MITLIRWILLKQREIKVKLAFYMFLDKQLKDFTKNPDKVMNNIMKEIAPHIASLVHDEVVKQKEASHDKSRS